MVHRLVLKMLVSIPQSPCAQCATTYICTQFFLKDNHFISIQQDTIGHSNNWPSVANNVAVEIVGHIEGQLTSIGLRAAITISSDPELYNFPGAGGCSAENI